MHDLKVGGQNIGTTLEHPFYVPGKGWTPTGELATGDRIPGLNSRESVAIRGVSATGRYEKVYNLCVADYHTYFVGDADWGFALWAHNAYQQPTSFPGTRTVDTRKLLPPLGGRQYADPAKLAQHGPFDWAKYQPIVVEQTKGGLMYILDGMTRVENAQRAGIIHLPAIIRIT